MLWRSRWVGVIGWSVAPVRNAAGEHLVLKVGWRHDEALHEAHSAEITADSPAIPG